MHECLFSGPKLFATFPLSYIHAISTALPDFGYSQEELGQVFANGTEDENIKRKIRKLSQKSGIERRFSVISGFRDLTAEPTGFHPRNSLASKMEIYEQEALTLSQKAICKIPDFEAIKSKITHLITVSCTGLAAPGLDIELCRQLQLSPGIKRTGLYFMGCNASILAFRQAHAFCQSDKDTLVLVVSTELCTLHFQENYEDDYLISNTLFSDGSGAVLVGNQSPFGKSGLHWKMESFHSQLLHQGRKEMAWRIGDKAFLINLSGYVSELISQNLAKMMHGLDLNLREITYWAIHPGGVKILDGFARALNLKKDELTHSYEVLRQYGNMSSVSIIFVLQDLVNQKAEFGQNEKIFSAAFGPGLSIESMVLDYVFHQE